MSAETEWPEFKARRFIVPAGPGRCPECGFHETTQGHRVGCPQPPVTPAQPGQGVANWLDFITAGSGGDE